MISNGWTNIIFIEIARYLYWIRILYELSNHFKQTGDLHEYACCSFIIKRLTFLTEISEKIQIYWMSN